MPTEAERIQEILDQDCLIQHLTHYIEGYKEFILTQRKGEQIVEDMGIDTNRFSPGSTRRFSYNEGWFDAQNDYNNLNK